MSPAKDLGSRHVCWKCGSKFYDLNKPSPTCPKCGADPREDPALKAPVKAAKQPAPAPKRAHAEEAEAEEERFEEEEGDDEDGDEGGDEPAEDDELY